MELHPKTILLIIIRIARDTSNGLDQSEIDALIVVPSLQYNLYFNVSYLSINTYMYIYTVYTYTYIYI